ncbi:MAG: AAA family ATPase [Cytophagales bacterium]|nr:AAA family ATPase [Cytophagales bacterium]
MAISAASIKKATKVSKKLRCLITGQTGAGKTASSLLLAKGLTNNGRVLVFDTENGRASLKVDMPELQGFDYDVIEVSSQDVTSDDYIKAVEIAEQSGYDAVILDSATHEWEYVKELHNRLGGRYTDWGKAKAGHFRFIKKVISAKIHVIVTARSDIKHEQQEVNGRKQVVKLGLGTQQNSNFPYEMDFVFDIQDRQHNCVCDKSEGGLFTEPLFVITPQTGVVLAQYLSDGIDPETETKKKYAARIRELEGALLGAGVLSESEIKTIEERDPAAFLSMGIDDLKSLGLLLNNKVKEAGVTV